MFFVVNKSRLQRMIALTRDDRRTGPQTAIGPYFRIEAHSDRLKLTGLEVEAEFPATVYEEGVLFLRITEFRHVLATFVGEKSVAIQVSARGLHIGNVSFALDSNDMLLYADPKTAPLKHPGDRQTDSPPEQSLFPEQ